MNDERVNVVTAFLLDSYRRILLLKRSESVRTYRGVWGAVSGYLETRDPLLQAEREITEETGIEPQNCRLEVKGRPLLVDDPRNHNYWRVHSFQFSVIHGHTDVELSDEHVRYTWISPDRITGHQTVPSLRETWERVDG